MLRSTLAVLGGLATTFLSVTSLLALLVFLASDEFPSEPGPYTGADYVLWIEVGLSLLAAMAGGFVCAWIAGRNEMKHALVLTGILLVLGVISIASNEGLKPLWSSVAVALIGTLGVLPGARLRAFIARS